MFRRLGLNVLALAALSASASAADMPLKTPAPAAAPHLWSGWYIGGQVGGGRTANSDDAFVDPSKAGFAMCAPCGSASWRNESLSGSHTSGLIGGAHLGYNWQLAPRWLIGVEADWSYAHLNDSRSGAMLNGTGGGLPAGAPVPGSSLTFQTDIHWLASIRGRAGLTLDQWFAYVTGGAAWADMDLRANAFCNAATCPPNGWQGGPVSQKKIKFGPVVGGGLEWHAPMSGWSARLEYLYYKFNGNDVNGAWTDVSTGGAFCGPVNCATNFTFGDIKIHMARLGVSYAFGSGPAR